MGGTGICTKKRIVLGVIAGLCVAFTCYPAQRRLGTTSTGPPVDAAVAQTAAPVTEAPVTEAPVAAPVAMVDVPEIEVKEEMVQNHVYQQELARGDTNCSAFSEDQELMKRGWNFSRYPWNIVKHGTKTAGNAVLYGTAFAQKSIWEHQHPADCSRAKFLEYYHQSSGIGSQLHLLGQALALAMHLGRILVMPRKDVNRHFHDGSFCPGEDGWHCWFQHITWCKPERGIMKTYGYPMVKNFTGKDVPEIFHQMLSECSPMKPRFWFYWWRAQSMAYLIRFNKKTRRAVDEMRSETLFQCQNPAKSNILPPGTVSVHVRHGFKNWEAKLFEFEDYAMQMNALAAGNQQLRILYPEVAESNRSFSYPRQRYAKRRAFLSTEDPKVVVEALKLCNAKDPWRVTYTKVFRNNKDPWMHVEKAGAARREVLVALMNLELALEADAWVCTLTSNWCRLIDELRNTIARKASHPYISLSKVVLIKRCRQRKGHTIAPECYLDF